MDFSNKVGFTIGSGRCGILFLYQLMEKEPEVASSHERNPDNEAFHRYCRWNDMTRMGKVAWFRKAFNERILDLLQELPEESYRLIR